MGVRDSLESPTGPAPTRLKRHATILAIVLITLFLTACGGSRNARPSSRGGSSTAPSGGRYDDIRKSQGSRYRSRSDSVPTDIPDVNKLPEPVPKVEPRSLYGNKSPYSVLGQTYNVLPSPRGYVERGIASFYGNKFHGYKTSSLEEYDMYQFSAAHKTLPLPSYARVTNLENGKSVIVRVNDRGPFHENRIIDLSFAAAVKIGVWPKGTGLVEVRAIDPNDPGSDRGAPYVNNAPKPAPIMAPPPSPQRAVTASVGTNPADDDGHVPGMTGVSPSEALPPLAAATTNVPASTTSSAPVPAQATAARQAPPSPPGAASSQGIAANPGPITAPSAGKPSIYLQVGAFSDVVNANRVADRLNRAGLGPVSVVETNIGGRNVRRVRVGPLADVDTADRVTEQIAGMGLPRPQVAVD
ncbi:rare lipoprotein A [Luteibacter jiangsuensis]|uniref:Endolytic peptidoglycan transglycosylase RlpA n=1 Tax=Luteibacter jiangsuensis TaxID=637577 RepID=A0ABT9SXR8_9GAMM|nr:septal ring lytic transglycosylase RlpA family protein [Luteibacter jiangsuensis]MDQ0009800.1 rare lipoprotein A [Luteibacter jiangsuensis]